MSKKTNVLIGATGSVASVKIPLIVKTLKEELGDQIEVKVVTTKPALHFFKVDDVQAQVITDEHEWSAWTKLSDPVMHIELRNWADMFVICPLDANTLAKAAQGLCDNLITCILRAWDERRPVVVCPAMNTNMWNHTFTALHLKTLTEVLHYRVIPPISKLLACGDLGIGAMADYRTIVDEIRHLVQERSSEASREGNSVQMENTLKTCGCSNAEWDLHPNAMRNIENTGTDEQVRELHSKCQHPCTTQCHTAPKQQQQQQQKRTQSPCRCGITEEWDLHPQAIRRIENEASSEDVAKLHQLEECKQHSL
ncbi:hypothetical protein DFQ26_003774 [Actinomortierella ambigua]|nr:hypothetical protein DFQ26_003774 [Actinomortierella ambigua]